MRSVRAEGLEPPRFSPPEPKSGASTSSATPARAAERGVYRSGRVYSTPDGGRSKKVTFTPPIVLPESWLAKRAMTGTLA